MKDIRRVAIHEAGHAAMHLFNGIPFNEVSIVPGKADGVEYSGILLSNGMPIDGTAYDVAVRMAMCAMAGHVAEEILCGHPLNEGSGPDLENAKKHAALIMKPGGEQEKAFMAWIAWRCDDELRKQWHVVQRIAELLLLLKRIKYDQLKLIIKQTGPKGATLQPPRYDKCQTGQ